MEQKAFIFYPPLPPGPQVTGILTGDVRLIGESLDSDVIIEPVRSCGERTPLTW